MTVRVALALAAAVVGGATPPAPETKPLTAAAFRAEGARLIAVLGGGGDPAAVFTPAFLKAVPVAKVRAISASVVAGLGRPLRISSLTPTGARTARLVIAYEHGTATFDMGVAENGRIGGLLIVGQASDERDLAGVVATLRALPGLTGFELARLEDAGPQPIVTLEPERPAAIGSAFKLAILAELVREVQAGRRQWSDTVVLTGAALPGGLYADKPKGTAVPLQELAARMIALSDNSAADVLLALVGREAVEALLPTLGWRSAARDRPLLSTLELFKLKAVAGGAPGKRFLALDEAGRRALLAGEVAATPLSAIDPNAFQRDHPLALDIEWFASPSDLVRTMDWLRRATDGPDGAVPRAILSANPGVGPATAAAWSYVGYKGGSEPGVMNMTLLLQGKDGGWYAMSAGWNNAAAGLDEGRLLRLVSRAVELAATPPPASPR